jgi:hypothetical protein
MSAIHPKADIAGRQLDVRLVPKPEVNITCCTQGVSMRMKSYLCADRTTYTSSVLLLQVDGLVMPGFVELCTPHPVHALVVGPAEDHGSAQPNVEIV